MNTTSTEVVAAGTDSITGLINNLTGTAQVIGAAMVSLVFVVIGLMWLTGALSSGGGMRKHLTSIAIGAVGAIIIGGGVAIGPMMVDTGKELPKGTTSQTGVN